MATRKRKTIGTSLKYIQIDPLRELLGKVFAEFPEGVDRAHSFLAEPDGKPFLHISDRNNIWRVRDGFIDSYVNGKSDRIEICPTLTKNFPQDAT